MKKILIVDDEKPISDIIKFNMTREGYEVVTAFDGREALDIFEAEFPDIVILDLMLPEIDGLEVARTIRKTSNVPILMLSAKDSEFDKVIGLEIGADDYVTKPFDVAEFEARVRSLLRRQAGLRAATIPLGPLTFDLVARQFRVGGEAIDLPARELALLELLVTRAGRVVTRDAIVQSLTTIDDELSGNAIEQYISRLRRRLSPLGLNLRTARGLGYFIEKPREGP